MPDRTTLVIAHRLSTIEHADQVLVLDGAIDPSASGLDVGTTQAIGFESALRAYMADCLDGRGCPFTGTVDQAMADLGTLLASVDAQPLPADDGRMLGADTLMTGIIAALYERERSGVGQVIDAAMIDAATAMLALRKVSSGDGYWPASNLLSIWLSSVWSLGLAVARASAIRRRTLRIEWSKL